MSAPGTVAFPGLQTPPLDETIWAVTDDAVGGWEKGGTASGTSNLWQAVDSESDADYITLSIPEAGAGSHSSTFRFIMDVPSGEPAGTQTVFAQVRGQWIDVFNDGNPGSGPTLTIRIKQGSATTRASQGSISMNEQDAAGFTDHTCFMSEAEINSVTDWSDIRVECTIDVSSLNTDQEINYEFSEVRIIFSP